MTDFRKVLHSLRSRGEQNTKKQVADACHDKVVPTAVPAALPVLRTSHAGGALFAGDSLLFPAG
jgi:hypothetical protein